jgi:transposase
MTQSIVDTQAKVWVAIDISKERHDVLLELPDGRRKGFRISNHKADFDLFAAYLSGLELPCHIAFEATGDYHRILANFLHTQGFKLHLISSIATARTREALYNAWDKNDAKDAQVILHLLKTGATQTYHDPLIHNYNDLQEIANTYQQVSLRKTKLLHSILNHYLPLYFPEAQRYYHNSRAQWFGNLLLLAPRY